MRRESFCLIFSIYLSGMCMFCPLGPMMKCSYWNSKYRCSLPHDSSFNETKQSWRSGDGKFRVHRCSAGDEDYTYVCMRCKNNDQKHMGKNAAFNHMIQTNCSSWEDVHRVEKKEIFTRLKLQKQTSLTKIKITEYCDHSITKILERY